MVSDGSGYRIAGPGSGRRKREQREVASQLIENLLRSGGLVDAAVVQDQMKTLRPRKGLRKCTREARRTGRRSNILPKNRYRTCAPWRSRGS
jgi:hypothetical protein